MNFRALSPQIGFSYRLNDFSLFGGYSSGYETPTLSELSATVDGKRRIQQESRYSTSPSTMRIPKKLVWMVSYCYKVKNYSIINSWIKYCNQKTDILTLRIGKFSRQTLYQNIGETHKNGILTKQYFQAEFKIYLIRCIAIMYASMLLVEDFMKLVPHVHFF